MTAPDLDALCKNSRGAADACLAIQRDVRIDPRNLISLLDALDYFRDASTEIRSDIICPFCTMRNGIYVEHCWTHRELQEARADLKERTEIAEMRRMEMVPLARDLEAARADLREALALLDGTGPEIEFEEWTWRRDALLARHKEAT